MAIIKMKHSYLQLSYLYSGHYYIWIDSHNINPLRAIFFRESINIYLHFMSFLHTNKTQVVEIPPRVRQGPAV